MSNFLKTIRKTIQEWQNHGSCCGAIQLNEFIGQDYFDTCNPHFYTGNLTSKLVMIQLNPKREIKDFNLKSTKSIESYMDFYSNYGKHVYGTASGQRFKSKFDQKLIRFLKPLNLLDLNNTDIFQNLENVVDQKLQVEFIPFGSPNFDYTLIPQHRLDYYMELILDLITSETRECVIFGGRVFSELLKPYTIGKEIHRFKLQKVNGDWTKNDYEIEQIALNYNGKIFHAFIAPQFAQQGMPVEAYGKQLAKIMAVNNFQTKFNS
jgi:hypothetical protein